MANYEFLPGVDISVADGGLVLPEDTTTESLLIIAPSLAENAPSEPVLVRQASDLLSNGFGDFYVNGQVNRIAAEWKAAVDAGNRRVYLLALKGATDKERFLFLHDLFFGVLADFSVDHVSLVGVYADKEVEGLVKADFESEEVQEQFPHVEGMRITAEAVTADEILTAPIQITTGTNDTFTLNVVPAGKPAKDVTITIAPADYNGVDKKIEDLVQDLKVELEKVTDVKLTVLLNNGRLTIMSDSPFTMKAGTALTVLGFKVDTKSAIIADPRGLIVKGNFAKILADFAERQTLVLSSVIGYIGVEGAKQTTMAGIKAHVDKLVALHNQYSGYVQVIAHEVAVLMPMTNQLYFLNGCTHYASLLSQLRAESAPTNKVLKGVRGIRYNYSLRQLNALTKAKYVTFRLKNGQLIVTDGVTTAPDLTLGGVTRSSDFARLSTLRITQEAIKVVRNACEPFIGEPNQMPQYNALNAAIKGSLEAMRSAGALSDYKFTVIASPGTLDSARVTLVLVPMFELRNISVDVSLRPPTSYTGVAL